MSAFLFIFTSIGALFLRCIENLPMSLWLNLWLKYATRLRDLTYHFMCGVQRWGSYSKIMLTTTIEHGISPCNLCDLLSTFLLLYLFMVEYLLTQDISIFLFYKQNSTLTLWGIECRSVTHNLN